MKTFEEWWHSNSNRILRKKYDGERGRCEEVFDAAREGMIPDDQAIKVTEAQAFECVVLKIQKYLKFQRNDFAWIEGLSRAIVRELILLPTPAWTPKVLDVVFARFEDGHYEKGQIETVNDDGWHYVQIYSDHVHVGFNGTCRVRMFKDIKPFDASKIGLKWDDI